ncbi:MAG: hypothetical protein IT495_06080 [Gammaproteobacteria bacterium]|nr:hypothetical protein [Gammaproteobacteria bacterium]
MNEQIEAGTGSDFRIFADALPALGLPVPDIKQDMERSAQRYALFADFNRRGLPLGDRVHRAAHRSPAREWGARVVALGVRGFPEHRRRRQRQQAARGAGEHLLRHLHYQRSFMCGEWFVRGESSYTSEPFGNQNENPLVGTGGGNEIINARPGWVSRDEL